MVLVAAGLPLAGCRWVKDMFSPQAEVAAEVAGQQLTVAQLAEMMASIKGVPQTPEAAELIVNMWVDHTLFAQSLAAGHTLEDSALVAEVMWPEISELRGARWHDTLMARRDVLTPMAADSIYSADSVRLLQHLLIRADAKSLPAARTAAAKKAQAAYARIRAGANFGVLASQLSEDPASKADSGYLTPAARGAWVTAFDSAGWILPPGGISGVVETPFGYHVIRRPTAVEARSRLLAYARTRLEARLDSVYLDSLGMQKQLKIEKDAPASMRAALANAQGLAKSRRSLATYTGGAVTVADFVHWATALGPSWSVDAANRPDSSLVQFARLMAQNELLLRQADSAGITIGPGDWAVMMQGYRAQLDSLRRGLELSDPQISDPATAPSERAKLAGLKVEAFWKRIMEGKAHPRPVPSLLAAVLRQQSTFTISQAGVLRAVEEAPGIKGKANPAGAAEKPRPIVPPAPIVTPGGQSTPGTR
jgi:hypothetical protein